MSDKQIKQPTTNKVAKVPFIMQMEALECGAASLCMVLAYYDLWIPLEKVRSDCGVSRDGSNARNILKAARSYGLEANGYKLEPEELKKEAIFPCIIHWNFNHFVVLNGFKKDKVSLNDPAKGTYEVSYKTFDESYTGICLMFSPNENFKPSGKPQSMVKYALKRLKGAEFAIVFTVLTMVITSLMGIISPLFSRIFIDRLLTGLNTNWAKAFLVSLALFNVIEIIVSATQAIYSNRINGKLAVVGNVQYMWKVLHLPLNFFAQRMAGDILSRQNTNANIANTLINTFAPLVLNSVMVIFYLVIMLRYSVLLTIIGLFSLLINAIVTNHITKKRVNITRQIARDSAKLASTEIAGVEMVETIKASGAEDGYFGKWAGYQASVNAQNVKAASQSQYLSMILAFISSISNYAILIAGVYLTMKGEFTVGMVMAFQGFLASFMAPANTFVRSSQTLQELKTEVERVEDVMSYPVETIFKDEEENSEYSKLSGNVEVKNVTFGYSPLGEPIVKNFSLNVKCGNSVALVGGSGCGKSTMSKLISGLYKPWEGEILFDGKKMSEISSSVFRGSLAVVDQDVILFEDTIANNIKMWDNSIEDFEMILAARDAQIHEDIIARADGYNHKLIEGGKDFSGGQRQRLEIARVLAQDPTIIILDEATSALDAKTEYEVVKAIKERGITCIVIAHRLSTIRDCDEIIVLDNGEVVNRGKHDYLMENCDKYRDLVISE